MIFMNLLHQSTKEICIIYMSLCQYLMEVKKDFFVWFGKCGGCMFTSGKDLTAEALGRLKGGV